MAAPRIRCAHCGDPFDRRQVTTSYCAKEDCQRAHHRDRMRALRTVHRQMDSHRIQKWTAS